MGPQDLVFFAVVALIGYFLIVRPQRARAQQLQQVRESLAVGSRVITTAGLYATVTAVAADTIELEIADGVRATFASAAVVRVLASDTDTDTDDQISPAQDTAT